MPPRTRRNLADREDATAREVRKYLRAVKKADERDEAADAANRALELQVAELQVRVDEERQRADAADAGRQLQVRVKEDQLEDQVGLPRAQAKEEGTRAKEAKATAMQAEARLERAEVAIRAAQAEAAEVRREAFDAARHDPRFKALVNECAAELAEQQIARRFLETNREVLRANTRVLEMMANMESL
ncbi:nuclease SbcCD subunit C-like [Thrips palmi]|uniref:Nuclease SbcCD subunit C-like n=1 Tax=Thrips palmi TaxID=161013 RepID=A0A6P9A6I0_THRPL|nr:nuclease SbcCD subunit C-like [Thrips palmi]